MTTFAIAGLQLNGQAGDNTASVLEEIDKVMIRFPWIEMIVLPELTTCGADRSLAESMPGPTEARLRASARSHGIWLVPGSIYEADGDLLYNTVPVIDPDGTVIARYRKMFPWTPYEAGVTPGSDFVVFDVPGVGRFGVSNCYDMWFPETIRSMVWMGAEVILHPSLTSTIDRDAEIAMIKAHGAQNQVYFFDVNLAGPLGVGQSCIAGPGGEVIYQAGREREIMPLKLDLGYLHDVRENGWQNLGQPLKSFRDSELSFPPYTEGFSSEPLRDLGALSKVQRPGRQ
jgi:predicted amidohydrolase